MTQARPSAPSTPSNLSALTRLTRMLREAWLDLLALVWPAECIGCGAPDRECCDPCRESVRVVAPVIERDIGVPCYAADHYGGAVRAMLVELKHSGRLQFARALGPRLRQPLAAALAHVQGPGAPIIVTAPSRRARVRQRGYRHVDVLVSAALRGQRVPVLRIRPLRALRGRTAQLGLQAAERERNAQRLAVRQSCRALLAGREAIIFDDVVTTGATLRAMTYALESAGATVVAAVALCAVRRRDDDSVNIAGGISGGDHGRVPERRNGASEGPPA